MKKATILIPDMQHVHCQTRVYIAVNVIEGAGIQNIEAGKLTVSFISEKVKKEIIDTLENAGYTVDPKNPE